MIRISGLSLPLGKNEKFLWAKAAELLGIPVQSIRSLTIAKKSVDARKKNNVHFTYSVDIEIDNTSQEARFVGHKGPCTITIPTPYRYELSRVSGSLPHRPVVVGTGPAGLFAALILAQCGLSPLVVERGMDVETRQKDVERFRTTGLFHPGSNVQFGEGGAGTFSDGKLTTGIKDPRCRKVLEEFVSAGAPEEILYLAKPHIGTDLLVSIVKKLRESIVRLGGEVLFDTKLTGLSLENGKLCAVQLTQEGQHKTIVTDSLILAIGHSARDTFEMLHQAGLPMEQKAFSAGVRIEHLQKCINQSQYGKFASHPALGAADYKLSVRLPNGRGVYTFCMCPGGEVVAAASEKGGVCVNGMSRYRRDGVNANSALLVDVRPTDFPSSHPLAGVQFQRQMERAAYTLGGGNYHAPAQLVGDFLGQKASTVLGSVEPTYRPGVRLCRLDACLPEFISQSIRQALPLLDGRLKGFAAQDAVLTGVETRSSSPVRMIRDQTGQSPIRGIYPCGEGAGYAGGIMSAAVDGIRCAEYLISNQLTF
ncbi:putative FAD-binding dehydrogenase [Eubacteriaceae bacterium CHKCI005]|nr:putative FAD-binding dehydrogenase [Eubacteriaceae bacterium CHKCI005]